MDKVRKNKRATKAQNVHILAPTKKHTKDGVISMSKVKIGGVKSKVTL